MIRIVRTTFLVAMIFFYLPALRAQSIRITEYMYGGTDNEFVEFTNTGSTTVDMTGWSFDDDSRIAGTVSLSAFGMVQPGESVILAENTAAAFRTAWGLCSNVKVIGSLTTNLGRADEINLFNAASVLVDRLTYGDQTFPGTIRTQNRSGWVSAAGLGNNVIAEWTLAAASDGEASFTSAGGDIGSPGKSTRATVAYNPCPPGVMRITEFMYDGVNLEFIEFTNTGATAVDMNGYSFDDNTRLSGSVNLSAFGMVQPGESVILSENNASAFRTAWGLCNGIKIIGGLTENLGRSDEINLFNAAGVLVDRLTYGDQTFPGSIRTQNKSGWVNAAGLGINDITKWVLSAAADAETSFASTGNDIGSPGKSTRALIAYNPCTVVAGAPVISIDVVATTNSLDGGIATSPASPFAVSSVIGNASDAAATSGINFTIGDDITPVGSLTVSVSSSNTTVVPAANLALTGSGASRNLRITPAGVGYSTITVVVNDGTYNTSYIISYAASAALTGNWPTGISDASAAIALDNTYMVIGNDESNLLYLYDRTASGLPVKTYDLNAANILALTDGSTGNWKEVDLEAAVNSIAHPGRTYWLGSMSNSSSFNDKPNRDRIVSIDINGTGAAASFSNTGYYAGLRSKLITWGDANGYNFTASAADGKDPKTIDGFNAEGVVFGPDNTTLYIGFRAPFVPVGNRTKAVIAPVADFENWFNNGAPSGNPVIGAPIELDLGGRGIRDIIRLANGNYVIVAGSFDETSIPAIFRWTGNSADAPVALSSFDLTGMNAEGVMPVYQSGQLATDKLQIIADNGDNIFYNDGVAAKDLPQDNYKKFRSAIVTSSVIEVLPVHFEYFTAQEHGADVDLDWKNGALDNAASFDIMRSANGVSFSRVGSVAAVPNQTNYTFTDVQVPAGKLYYRIQAKDVYGKVFLSTVRLVTINAGNTPLITLYPNPVSNGLFTLTVRTTGSKKMNIYNSAGVLYKQLVFTGTAKDITTENWPKGYYLLSIQAADGNLFTEKIIVQ